MSRLRPFLTGEKDGFNWVLVPAAYSKDNPVLSY